MSFFDHVAEEFMIQTERSRKNELLEHESDGT